MSDFASLEPQDVREHWRHESEDFTPWLEEQIGAEEPSELENVLGLDLEVIEREKPVGRYFVDIYGRVVDDDRTLIIENQLATSDHDHLGKAIAYAAGLDAAIIVWIAPEFRDEHRDAVQWLNSSSREGIDFFAIRLEVWRIGDSKPAVRLNTVEEPSEWKQKAQRSTGELSEIASFQEEFWTGFRDRIRESSSSLRPRKPRARHFYSNPIGVGGYHISFQIDVQADEMYLDLIVEDDKDAYYELKANETEIEQELGMDVTWGEPRETRTGKIRSNIRVAREAELSDRGKWDEYYEWMLEVGEKYRAVLRPRILELE